MALPDLTGIADAAAAVLTARAITSRGQALKVYPTEPAAIDSWPSATIRLDSFSRRGIDEADLELGVALWDLEYEVAVEVVLTDVDESQRAMHAVIAEVIDALDESAALGRADVDDAVLESGQQFYVTGTQGEPQRIRFECVLAVRARST